jgi:hypothetical protein
METSVVDETMQEQEEHAGEPEWIINKDRVEPGLFNKFLEALRSFF